MKKLLTLSLICLFLFFSFFGNTQTEKIFVKTFNLEGKTTVTLNVTGSVEVVHNNNGNDIARIQLTVNLPHNNENVLKVCAETGRYLLRLEKDVKEIIVTAPALKFGVKTGNNFIEENVSYFVNVPKGIEVNVAPKSPAKLLLN
jgi:hypothetical protein